MKPKEFDKKDLQTFTELYSCSEIMFGLDICDAGAAKQKKARKKLFKVFAEEIEGLSDEARTYLSDNVSDREVFLRLRACFDANAERLEEEKRAVEHTVATLAPDWDADTQREVTDFLQRNEWPYDAVLKNGVLCLTHNSEFICDSVLLFSDAQGVPQNAEGCETCDLNFSKSGDRYHIRGTLVRDLDGESEPLDFSFSDACIECTVFRADWEDLSDTPWDRLIAQSAAICAKEVLLATAAYNEREAALLPLLRELASLSHDSGISDDLRVSEFPLLSQLFAKKGYAKPQKLLEKLNGKEPTSYAFISGSQRLIATLNEKAHESLWRELYAKICDSQEEYVTPSAFYQTDATLPDLRRRIENRMHVYGYTGSYPDFVKVGEIRGLHVRSSYGMSYFVGRTRHAVFHVHCQESASLNTCTFRFLSGTALIKRGEQSPDVTDCLFNAKGKRFFGTTDCNLFFGDAAEGLESEDIDLAIDIAIKKAELRRMNRAEKKQDASATVGSSILLFLFCLLFMGTFFGLFMTLGFILIEFLTCLFTGLLYTFPELFMTTPWWLIGLTAGGLFGIAMGIVEVIANRKK